MAALRSPRLAPNIFFQDLGQAGENSWGLPNLSLTMDSETLCQHAPILSGVWQLVSFVMATGMSSC